MKQTITVQGRLYGKPVSVDLEVLGPCPDCAKRGVAGHVYERDTAWGCTNYQGPTKEGSCQLTIWKSFSGKTLTEAEVEQLLTRAYTDKIDGFVTKDGSRHYGMRLCLKEGRVTKYAGPVETASAA